MEREKLKKIKIIVYQGSLIVRQFGSACDETFQLFHAPEISPLVLNLRTHLQDPSIKQLMIAWDGEQVFEYSQEREESKPVFYTPGGWENELEKIATLAEKARERRADDLRYFNSREVLAKYFL